MRPISPFGFFFLLLIFFAFAGCEPCRKTDCGMGDCAGGDCECPQELTGNQCETHLHARMSGELIAWRKISWPNWEETNPAHAMHVVFSAEGDDTVLGYPIEWIGTATFRLLHGTSGKPIGAGSVTNDSVFCTYTDAWNYEWRGGKN